MTDATPEGGPTLRRLPGRWIHRTATRTWTGPLTEGPAGWSPGDPGRGAALRGHLEVLRVLTRGDFLSRYRAQALGIVWSLLNPLVTMAILSLIFTRVFNATAPHFPIFFLIGHITWQWVASSTTVATQSFVSQSELIKRTVFLRQLLPISAVLSYGFNFCLESCLLLLLIPFFPGAFQLSPALLLVPVFLFVLIVLLIGVNLMTSVLNVIYRDVAYIVTTGLTLFYWLTPVIYPPNVLPEPYRTILHFNPLASILVGLRSAVMEGRSPDGIAWLGMTVPTLVMLLIGWLVYRHYERMVLDHV